MDVMISRHKVHEMYPQVKRHNLKYWKRLQEVMDARHTLTHNLELRKHWLDRQQSMNYHNEYDRLRNALSQTILRRHPLSGTLVREHMHPDVRRNVEARLKELQPGG